MSWFTSLFSSGTSSLVQTVANVADEFNLSEEEKQVFRMKVQQTALKVQETLEESLRAEVEAKEKILVAELQQGDNFTKRARPAVVYAGLFFVLVNHVIVPLCASFFAFTITPIAIPTAFWAGWSGIVATWSVGRTVEKQGIKNKLTSMIIGK